MEQETGKQKRQSNPLGLILKILGALLLLCIVFVAATFGLVMFLTQDMAKAGDDFMQAIQENRLDDAYAMLANDALEDVDMETFSATFEESELTAWSFNSRNVNNDQGDLSGTAQFGENTYDVSLVLQKIDDTWKIIGYNFENADSSED
jgi:hypothetical protein